FKPGDRIIGSSIAGGMAEKLVLDAGLCIAMPAAMPFDEASALVLTYGTTIYALKDRGHLQRGETLLVLGAAGGVGISAIELGKAYGARVIAAVSSEDKLAFARKHGADDGVVYAQGPFDKAGSKALADLFKKACGETGANVIYDPVGGDYSEAALRSIAWEGRFLVVGVFWGAFTRRDPKAHAANVAELMALYAKGAIKPIVSEHYPLAKAGDAIARLATRKAMGKI